MIMQAVAAERRILERMSNKGKKKREDILGEWRNKIICGDCLEVMRSMPDGSVDLIVTSPPYNLKNSTGNGMKDGRGGKWSNAALINGYAEHHDCMPHDEYAEWQRKCLTEMLRLIPDDGAIFYNHKWRVQGGLIQDRQDIVAGFPVRQIIIWRRKGGINFNPGYFLPTYEVIYIIAKPQFRLASKANAYGDVWEFMQEMENPHPAPFPLELIERIVSSTHAKVVLDPFMGSGTTAIAARNKGKDFIGIDVAKEYCDMARRRLDGNWNKGAGKVNGVKKEEKEQRRAPARPHGKGEVMDILELKEELLLLVDRLDNLVCMAGNKALPDDIHMTALREALPDLALELREHVETL